MFWGGRIAVLVSVRKQILFVSMDTGELVQTF